MSNFQFNDRMQKSFCAYLLRDTEVLRTIRQYIVFEHFSNEILRGVVRICVQFYDQYHTAPDDAVLTYIENLKHKGLLNEATTNLLTELCNDLLSEELKNKEFILDQYDQLLKHLAFGPAIWEAGELGKKGKFEEALDLLRKTMQNTPKGKRKIGQFYTCDPTDRIARREEEKEEIFWTSIKPFDERKLYIRRGELGMIQGQFSGMGKSIGLLHLAKNYVFRKWKVLILTLELSEDLYLDRMDMCVSGFTSDNINDADTLKPCTKYNIRQDDMFHVKKFDSYTTTVAQLEDYMQLLDEEYGFRPDVVMVDYADLLTPGVPGLQGDLYMGGLVIYSQLRNLAEKKNIGIWTVSQSNRGAADAKTAKASHVSNSVAKTQIADIAFSISQPEEDHESGIMTVAAIKVRNIKWFEPFRIQTDLAKMQFCKHEIGEGRDSLPDNDNEESGEAA